MEFYHYFKNIITPEKCAELNQIMFDKFDNQQLTFEGDDAHYKNSFGQVLFLSLMFCLKNSLLK